MDRQRAIELLRKWREEDEMIIEEELNLAIERLRRFNPHIDPEAIRRMVLGDEQQEDHDEEVQE